MAILTLEHSGPSTGFFDQRYLKLDGSNANTTIDIQGQNLENVGNLTVDKIGINVDDPQYPLHLVGEMFIDGNSDTVQQTIRAHPTQTANLTEWQDSGGSVLGVVDERGYVGAGGVSDPSYVFDGIGVLGAFRISDTDADATNKVMRLAGRHYNNDEEDVALFFVSSASTATTLAVGGGTGTRNAATQLDLYTATDNTTLTGTPRLRIHKSGRVCVGEQLNPSAKLHIKGDADDEQLIVQANSTQTANLTEWQSSDRSVLTFIDKDGYLGVGTTTSDTGSALTVDGYATFEQSHGELYTHENSVSASVVSVGTYYTITGLTAGVSSGSGYVVLNAASGTMTVGSGGAGLYRISAHISAAADKVSTLEFALHKNGTKENKASVKGKIGSANDEGAVSLTGLFDLVDTDELTIRVTSDAANTTVSIEHMNWNIVRVTR